MKIVLITPQGPTTRTGNRIAASRWARILRKLGHRVRVAADWNGEPADLMVAIHAWRSAKAVARFKARHPERPAILQLSGTDIYGYIKRDPGPTLRSMFLADRLVALNEFAWRAIPRQLRDRLVVIFQSAERPRRRKPGKRTVVVSVIGHLRDVKDPLRAAAAARLLPAGSRVRIEQAGGAYTPQWAVRARAEMKANPRYLWHGDVTRAAVRRLLGRSHAMVISSLSEGGANVISEACVAGVPVLASRIDGNVGLLGPDYPGYFPVGDTRALARLMRRLEEEPRFARKLARAAKARARLFTLRRETAAWKRLLAGLAASSPSWPAAGAGRCAAPAISPSAARSARPSSGRRPAGSSGR
jgi:putative glycosyltransferase (TIGR04348 family)